MKTIIMSTIFVALVLCAVIFAKSADVHELSEYKGYRVIKIEAFSQSYLSLTLENTLKDGRKIVVTKEFESFDVYPLLQFKNDTIQ
jgi:hypothetical protein